MRRTLCLAALAAAALGAESPDLLRQRALDMHHRILTVDTHCDTPLHMGPDFDLGTRHTPFAPESGCVDLPRMKEGGLDASFFAVFLGQGPRTPEGHATAKARALEILDRMDALYAQHPDLCGRATTAADAARIAGTGRRALYLGLENGYPVGRDVANVDVFYRRGVRYITLSHSWDNDLCDSSTDRRDPEDRGLSDLGRTVVQRMNALGMMVDVSHISERSFFDVLKVTKAPVLASHSCARALCDHPRNLTDDQLRALKANGGVIQLCILTEYLRKAPANPERDRAEADLDARVAKLGGWEALRGRPEAKGFHQAWRDIQKAYPPPPATVRDAVDHIDHIVKVIGVDHVGIGTDFDGGGGISDCRDVTELPNITVELVRRGYTEAEIRKIWGGNALRVMAAVEAAAR